MGIGFDAIFRSRSENVYVNALDSNVVSLFHVGVVIRLGHQLPVPFDPAVQLDDELGDVPFLCRIAVLYSGR